MLIVLYVYVPLYDTLGPGAENFIKDHAEVDVVFIQDMKVKEGKQNSSDILPPQPETIGAITYTSGTSGDPKGVVLTHENVVYGVRGVDLFMEQFEDKMTVNDVYLSFLPLAYILDRIIEEYFFRTGASVGYYHVDLNPLGDDMMELKPTLLAGVPGVFERIHEGIKSKECNCSIQGGRRFLTFFTDTNVLG